VPIAAGSANPGYAKLGSAKPRGSQKTPKGSANPRGSQKTPKGSAKSGSQKTPGGFLTAPVVIYTKDGCPYCADAKAKLDSARVPYTEVPVVGADGGPVPLPDGRTAYTVPQMFLPVGGFSDMGAWLPGALRRAPATPARK
jgi:glutaredoxin